MRRKRISFQTLINFNFLRYALLKQLLKWIGNKQRYASQIANLMPDYNSYIEPFLGSGAMLGTMSPRAGLAGDALEPLVRIWQLLQTDPEAL